MPYQNIPETGLDSSIAKLIGKLRSTFESNVSNNLAGVTSTFKQGCISEEEKKQVTTRLDNIKEASVNISDRLKRVRQLIDPLENSSRAILGLVKGIKFIPFPPFFPGGKIADVLTLVKELGIQLKTSAESIKLSLKQTSDLNNLLQKSVNIGKKVDIALEVCDVASNNGIQLDSKLLDNLVTGTDEESSKALTKLSRLLNRPELDTTGLKVTTKDQQSVQYVRSDGKVYNLVTVTVPSNFTSAAKRKVIAETLDGIKEFESEESFGSSIEVLRREVKFRIDNSQV